MLVNRSSVSNKTGKSVIPDIKGELQCKMDLGYV